MGWLETVLPLDCEEKGLTKDLATQKSREEKECSALMNFDKLEKGNFPESLQMILIIHPSTNCG